MISLVMDCDPGIDDSIALLFLAAHHRAGDLRIESVVAVGGNVPRAETCLNARYVLDAVGLRDVPVIGGEADGLPGAPERPDARAFHGPDGMGGCRGSSSRPPEAIEGGVNELERILKTDSPVLLATGPLTDVACLMRRAASPSPARVVVMGGAFGSPGGNISRFAEFNFWADPVAAAEVCRSDLPLELVPLDVTEHVEIRESEIATWLDPRSSPGAQLAACMLRSSIANHRREIGIEACYMHDPLAAAIVLHPELVSFRELVVDVITAGDAAGHVAWRSGGHRDDSIRRLARVALEVDAQRAKLVLLEALASV